MYFIVPSNVWSPSTKTRSSEANSLSAASRLIIEAAHPSCHTMRQTGSLVKTAGQSASVRRRLDGHQPALGGHGVCQIRGRNPDVGSEFEGSAGGEFGGEPPQESPTESVFAHRRHLGDGMAPVPDPSVSQGSVDELGVVSQPFQPGRFDRCGDGFRWPNQPPSDSPGQGLGRTVQGQIPPGRSLALSKWPSQTDMKWRASGPHGSGCHYSTLASVPR